MPAGTSGYFYVCAKVKQEETDCLTKGSLLV
jgi:hypothetical protein